MDKLFKALNDQTRRDILELLKEKELTAGEIADKFDISKPSISHHLDLLKQAGLIEADKQGQFIYYSLNTTVVDEFLKWLVELKQSKKKTKTASNAKRSFS
ncbi:MAG TPA: autorepressor SdpR family transcription factor [Flavipsychrobacter sp.]|nr:autorepressor SdpR family transcription factor [Flavipsychrobacter sp.]